MIDYQMPTLRLLESWVRKNGYDPVVHEGCNSLHVWDMRQLEGVADSRFVVYNDGLLFLTDFDLYEGAVLPLAQDILRLRDSYPSLKMFISNAQPGDNCILVTSALMPTSSGVNAARFQHFFHKTCRAMEHLRVECQHRMYLRPSASRLLQ